MQYCWRKDNKYYKLALQQNLFGTTDVVCCWGRIGSKLGGYKVISCNTEQDIINTIHKVHNRRRSRGYLAIL